MKAEKPNRRCRKISTKRMRWATYAVVSLAIWWNIGLVERYDENDSSTFLFIKEKPTLAFFFINPSYWVGVGDDSRLATIISSDGGWIRGSSFFDEFAAYCWHRFGISDITSAKAVETCNRID